LRALARLEKEQSQAALREVVEVFADHFAHEENLLDEHLYKEIAQGTSSFSADSGARKTHYLDHARILRELQLHLGSKETSAGAGLTSPSVPLEVIRKARMDFMLHGTTYDLYGERLAAVLREAEVRG